VIRHNLTLYLTEISSYLSRSRNEIPTVRFRYSYFRVARSMRLLAVARGIERLKSVKFSIEIGVNEKNHLEYHFNQLLGSLVIKINEKPITKSVRLINEPLFETHVVVVGEFEKSTVRIEKERKPLLGSRNRLYVNNRLLKVFDGV